jgi:putative transposase
MNRNKHRPIHIYLPNQTYFITISTYKKANLLNTPEKLDIAYKSIKQATNKYNSQLFAWVILNNHLHILIKIDKPENLTKFIKYINSRNAVLLNKIDQTPNRKVFYQYWDKCINDENEFYTRINYIHYNPVHHNHVQKPENYTHSSYREYLNKYEDEWMAESLEKHPLNQYRYKDDNF